MVILSQERHQETCMVEKRYLTQATGYGILSSPKSIYFSWLTCISSQGCESHETSQEGETDLWAELEINVRSKGEQRRLKLVWEPGRLHPSQERDSEYSFLIPQGCLLWDSELTTSRKKEADNKEVLIPKSQTWCSTCTKKIQTSCLNQWFLALFLHWVAQTHCRIRKDRDHEKQEHWEY